MIAKVYTENMNGQLYCDVLETELKLSMAKLAKKLKWFTKKISHHGTRRNVVKDKIAKLKLSILDWAPKRLDLNSIEMLWSTLEKKLTSRPIYSRTALMEALQEGMDNIDQELCIKLVDSMSKRVQKCLKAKGRHFL